MKSGWGRNNYCVEMHLSTEELAKKRMVIVNLWFCLKKRLSQVGYLDITACNIMIMILDLVILTGYAPVSSYLTFVLLDNISMSLVLYNLLILL